MPQLADTQHDVIPRRQVVNGFAYSLDHPRALVPEHDRERRRDPAVAHGHVGVADTRGHHAHLHFIGPGPIQSEFLEFESPVKFAGDCCRRRNHRVVPLVASAATGMPGARALP